MVLSDNAKTFKRASKEIMKIIRAKRVHTYFANKGMTWWFSVERAPWWGGGGCGNALLDQSKIV